MGCLFCGEITNGLKLLILICAGLVNQFVDCRSSLWETQFCVFIFFFLKICCVLIYITLFDLIYCISTWLFYGASW
uniref:Uncharacterized protein n=1 Tax=Rhizophora mucronata TaxID=61149 RepID=A0A2P2J202_RHIMU